MSVSNCTEEFIELISVTVYPKTARTGAVERHIEEHSRWRSQLGFLSCALSLTDLAIPDTATKHDMRQFARAEFERHKSVTELVSTLGLRLPVLPGD